MSDLKVEEKLFKHIRPLRDLPPGEEGRFRPNSYVPRKFLENMRGWVREEIKPFILVPPPDVAGYESDRYSRRAVTWEMVMERRRQRQRTELARKRSDYDVTYRKPLYVWVFWCPGFAGFIFRGWWLYLEGLHIREALDFRGFHEKLISEIITLFPLIEPTLFGPPDIDRWKAEFVKHYQRGFWCGKPQGKAPVWAEVNGSRIERILGRAEWPNRK